MVVCLFINVDGWVVKFIGEKIVNEFLCYEVLIKQLLFYLLDSRMIKVIVMDIEGIMISILFVVDVLFFYVRVRMVDFIIEYQGEFEVVRQIEVVCFEINNVDVSVQEVIDILIGWIDQDQKIMSLKLLQGMIW